MEGLDVALGAGVADTTSVKKADRRERDWKGFIMAEIDLLLWCGGIGKTLS